MQLFNVTTTPNTLKFYGSSADFLIPSVLLSFFSIYLLKGEKSTLMFPSCLKLNSRSLNDRKACHWTMLSVITLNSILSLFPSPFPFWGRTSHDSPAVSQSALHRVLSLHQFSLPIWFSYICNWTKLLIDFKYLFNIYLFKILTLCYSLGAS